MEKSGKTYNVTAYVVVRVKHEGIYADGQADAITGFDYRSLQHIAGAARSTTFEYADEILGFLVDESDDDEYEQTRYWVDRGNGYVSIQGRTDAGALAAIHRVLLGKRRTPGTLDKIARVLRAAGFEVPAI